MSCNDKNDQRTKNQTPLILKKASRLFHAAVFTHVRLYVRQLVTTISLEVSRVSPQQCAQFFGLRSRVRFDFGQTPGRPVAMRPSCKDSRGCLRRPRQMSGCTLRRISRRKRFPVETRLHRGKYARAERAADKSETISSDREREKVRVNTEDCSLVKPHE